MAAAAARARLPERVRSRMASAGHRAALGRRQGFALPDGGVTGVPMDPGPPPRLGDPLSDQAYKDEAVEVIRDSSELYPAAVATIDISPGALGANTLGTNDGHGHPANPVTGKPYDPDVVNLADFARSLTEFWADGPKSETPPGHWNVVANTVSDQLAPNPRIGGTGPAVDRLEWDVKLYFALNGATHDAAIAAWGLKGYYDSVRPISMIRYMASLGPVERSRPAVVQPRGPAPGSRSRRAHRDETPGPANAMRPRRSRRRDRHPGLGRGIRRPHDPDRRGRLESGHQLGPVSGPDLRDPIVPGLRVRPQHVQSSVGRSLTSFTGSEYFPGDSASGPSRRARSRSRPDRRRTSRFNGPPTTTPRTGPASRACTAGSTFRRTTSPVGRSARPAARRPGHGAALLRRPSRLVSGPLRA